MQVIKKTNFENDFIEEVFENVQNVIEIDGSDSLIGIQYINDNGFPETKFITLDGYVDLIVR